MIITLLLVELCLTFATSIVIQQDIPRNDSYRCPGGPTLRLKCKFAEGAIAVFWSSGRTTITVGFPGHEINNEMIDSGESYLRVNRSSDLKGNYRCIAVFPDASSQEQTIADFPEPANMTMKCRPGKINASSIEIKWDNTFPDCFNFTVWVEGNVTHALSADELSYTVTLNALSPNTTYNVCVVAEDGLRNTNKNWRHCDTITTNASATAAEEEKRCFCFDGIIGILLCILIPIVIAICLLVALIVILALCKRCFSHKAGKVHDGEKQQTAGQIPIDMQKQTSNNAVDQI